MDIEQIAEKSDNKVFNNYRVNNLAKFREYSKNYYHEKQKHNPEFMEKKRKAVLAKYYEKRTDPEFMEKQRLKQRQRYQKIKEQKLKEKEQI